MDFSRWQKRCWFSAFFYGRNQNIEFERDQKQKCWIQTKHSNCAQKMLPSVEACKSAERTINANEWKSGEMERKQANMFVLDLTIDTFQNIAGNTLIHIFKVSQKLEQCWNQYQQYIYNGEFQEKTYCYNSIYVWISFSPQAAERLRSCRLVQPCWRLQVMIYCFRKPNWLHSIILHWCKTPPQNTVQRPLPQHSDPNICCSSL